MSDGSVAVQSGSYARSMGDYDEPPDIDWGRRRQRCPSLAQSSGERPDTAKDQECRVRTRIIRRRLLLVEGHCPPPAERRQLHQRAEPSDLDQQEPRSEE